VAIKVSADRFTDRFEREARAIATLNHPNICTLHDVGPNYLVMELIEGPTLAERIKRGAIPLAAALLIAKQIADALDAAHSKGIVHRDLKPANIKLGDGDKVKVLDFGLAKTLKETAPQEDDVLQSLEDRPKRLLASDTEDPSTETAQLTRAGAILGTAAYMAPEQARGKPVDNRVDIWAFGVVLYEMLAGKPAFTGESLTEVLAGVMKEDPDLTKAPATAHRLLEACLQKNPAERLRAIADWRLFSKTFRRL
jgi:serine/threonine-protein kinase